jgi:hypothetical protein
MPIADCEKVDRSVGSTGRCASEGGIYQSSCGLSTAMRREPSWRAAMLSRKYFGGKVAMVVSLAWVVVCTGIVVSFGMGAR